MNERLINLGFTERWFQEASLYDGLFLGRVIAQSRDLYKVATCVADLFAEISGKLRYDARELADYPAVGDFVLLDRQEEQTGNAIIQQVLPRKSAFIRKAAGTAHTVQVVAANIDTLLICISLNHDFNLRRLERYLSIAWDSGAVPVIVLTKYDLCQDLPAKMSEISACAIGAEVVVTSSLTADGYKAIQKYLRPGQTVAFLGSSGVGKSTLINRLLGEDRLLTQGIRGDDKGRHTTNKRELWVIPGGGAVIDTPGMRELGVESVNLSKTFQDIDELAHDCKFGDCQHATEPGCAVQQAIADGSLSADRLVSYNKLKKEAQYDGLNSIQIEKEKMSEMYSKFGGAKNARDFIKSKNSSK